MYCRGSVDQHLGRWGVVCVGTSSGSAKAAVLPCISGGPIPPSRAGVRGRVNRSSENDAGSSATRKSLLLTSKSEMLTRKSLLLTSKSEMLTRKSLLLTSKSEMLTSKSLFLTSKSEMLTSKSLFLTSKSEMLASKSRFLTSKSEMLTRKSNFLINDVDCQLPPPGGEHNLALVASICRFLQ